MKTTTVSVIAVMATFAFLGGIMALSKSEIPSDTSTQSNISFIDGKQVVTIVAKGGYSPRNSTAKANLPTILKIKTMGTFDCSSAIVIPAIGYRKYLPASGETLVEIPAQKEDSTLQGICAMGMYNFAIQFS